MAWSLETQRGNSSPEHTGAKTSYFVIVRGCNASTSNLAEAPATSLRNLALLMGRFCSGFTNTASLGATPRGRGRLSIGGFLVLTTPCGTGAENLIQGGWVASARNAKPSIAAKSGRAPARLYGSATMQRASDVASTTTNNSTSRSISTTSRPSQSCGFARSHQTWFYSAKSAISSSIHGGM